MTARDKGLIVHQIKISQRAFEVTLQAVHTIGLINKRHELFSAVIHEAINNYTGIPQRVLDDFNGIQPIKGDIRMFIRIKPEFQKGFELLRSDLSEKLGARYSTREAVIVCCLLIAPRI